MPYIKCYVVEEPVDRPTYDREDIIRNLDFIREMIEAKGSESDMQVFKYCASEIESAYDYLMSRLSHAEAERFR